MTKQTVYLGPSMFHERELLTHGTIYADKLPKGIISACEANPELKALFVSVSDAGHSRQDVAAGAGTYLGAAYHRVKAAYEQRTNAKKV